MRSCSSLPPPQSQNTQFQCFSSLGLSLVFLCSSNRYASTFKWEVHLTFSSPPRPEWLWGSSTLLSNRYRNLSQEKLKRPEREADRSPPCRFEIKNTCCHASALPVQFHGMAFGYAGRGSSKKNCKLISLQNETQNHDMKRSNKYSEMLRNSVMWRTMLRNQNQI
jgi:hypothetical protein